MAENPPVTHSLAMPLLVASFGIALYSVMDAAMKRASLEGRC